MRSITYWNILRGLSYTFMFVKCFLDPQTGLNFLLRTLHVKWLDVHYLPQEVLLQVWYVNNIFLGDPAWIGEWVMLDCDADWIQCAGRLLDHQELWNISGMGARNSFFMESPWAIFPDKYCMDCLKRNGWKDRTVILFLHGSIQLVHHILGENTYKAQTSFEQE